MLVFNIDWRDIFASTLATLTLIPAICWLLTVFTYIMDWVLWACFPGYYARYQEVRRQQKEARRLEWEERRMKKALQGGEDIEQGEAIEVREAPSEETPLRNQETGRDLQGLQ
jgi:hypothetical protein